MRIPLGFIIFTTYVYDTLYTAIRHMQSIFIWVFKAKCQLLLFLIFSSADFCSGKKNLFFKNFEILGGFIGRFYFYETGVCVNYRTNTQKKTKRDLLNGGQSWRKKETKDLDIDLVHPYYSAHDNQMGIQKR